MISEINVPAKKGGGGLFGKVLGGIGAVGGAVAGGISGGPMGAVAGASGGMALGNAVGNTVSPVKGGTQVNSLKQVASQDPQVMFQDIQAAQKELLASTEFHPEEKKQLNDLIETHFKPYLKSTWERA